MQDGHPIFFRDTTWTMKYLLLIALALSASPVLAQSAYDRGWSAGYNDNFPASGAPSMTTDYGRGFNAGQDDSYDDEERHQEIIRRLGGGAPLDTD